MPYSADKAAKAIKFFERVLVHIDGEWSGRPFELMPWQREMIGTLFGTLREDGMRQYRTCYCEIPRKSGKSETAAGIALYLLFADGEDGAQIYGAAGDRDQAGIVYRVAAEMARRAPVLAKRAKVLDSVKRIVVEGNASFYRAIPAEASSSHGFNAHGIIVDEVHVQPNRDLIDVLNTSTGARRQPLTFYITTAGCDQNSICWELHDYALKVQKGVIQDPTFLPVVYNAEEGDNWKDPAVWAKANPSLGVTIKLDYLERECARAQETPAYENTFRRLHLNQWTRQETRWLPLDKWDACAGRVDPAMLAGQRCWAGLDLASTEDITALALVFADEDGGYDVLPYFWIPEATIERRTRRDRVPYELWARQGLVYTTPGNSCDYSFIRQKLNDLAEIYDIEDVAIDPWNARQLGGELMEDGFDVVDFRQGYVSMSAPTKELLRLVLAGKLRHGGNPVLRWMADNMVVTTDAAANIKPAKDKSTERIDGMVALIMALDRGTRRAPVRRSAYESHGLVSV